MSDFPKSILHADDDPMIRDIVERALRGNENLQYKTCEDGAELIKVAEEFQPELILLDLSMPGMDGVDVLETIHNAADKFSASIILFTGHTNIEMTPEYEKLGVIGVLHKPVSPGVLPERIRFFWVESQGRAGIPDQV